MTSRSRTMVQLAVALACGALFSVAKLAWVCRDPMSEGCVWGKAYRSIGMPLEALVAGAVVFAVIRVFSRPRQNR